MKEIIIREEQLMVIMEQEGLNNLFTTMSETYPDSVYMMSFLKDFIEKSGCKNIKVEPFKYKAFGLSTFDGLTLNVKVFSMPFSYFLYILFHEVAHQFQYKKYGIEKMYGCYTGEIPIEEGADFMKYCENIADEFAARKIREVIKLFGDKIKINNVKNQIYKDVPLDYFKKLIEMFISRIQEKGYTNKNDISEILYNIVKNG